MQAAALAQLAHQQLRECRLDQAALVVPLLVPWIGEIDTHFVQRAVGDFVFQHFHRVVVIQAHMGAAVFVQRVEQAAHARSMHLDADVIAAWVLPRGKAQRGAITEADLQHLVRIASEGGSQIARRTGVVQPEPRPQVVEGALLRGGETALAQHEAAHLPAALFDGEGLGRHLGAVAGERISHELSHRQNESPSPTGARRHNLRAMGARAWKHPRRRNGPGRGAERRLG